MHVTRAMKLRIKCVTHIGRTGYKISVGENRSVSVHLQSCVEVTEQVLGGGGDHR